MEKTLNKEEIVHSNCVYCGTIVKLNEEETETKTFYCPSCNRENVVWKLRKDFTEQIVQSNPTFMWISMGIISSIIGLFLFPPAFGAFGMFCGFKSFNKVGHYAGGFIIILSIVFMFIGLKNNPL